MKKSAVGVAVAAALGGVGVQAATVQVNLVGAVAGSMGSTSVVLLGASTATWSYDTVTGVVTGSGLLQHQSQANPALPGSIFTRDIVDLSWGGGLTSTAGATSYNCIDGSFSPLVSASFCGNYNFGGNGINESTNVFGPGTAFSQTIAGDDVSLGPQQSIAGYDAATSSWNGTTLVVSNLDTALTGGQAYTYVAAIPVPAAAWLFGSALGLLGWARRRAR